ncbi:MAG: hypothetical protein MI723_12345 [Caulobacterales bacterium]|nr:hypothetical protein [Caulobacterales bacterium]
MANRLFSALEAACIRFRPAAYRPPANENDHEHELSIRALKAACGDKARGRPN